MSKFVKTILYFMILVGVVGIVQATISWALNLSVGSNGEFKRPGNKGGDDYVNYDRLTDVANEVIQNHRRLQDLKQQLESNSFKDTVVQYTGLGVLILSTIFQIFSKIQAVKKVIKGEQGQQGQITTYPMATRQPDNIFGRASF